MQDSSPHISSCRPRRHLKTLSVNPHSARGLRSAHGLSEHAELIALLGSRIADWSVLQTLWLQSWPEFVHRLDGGIVTSLDTDANRRGYLLIKSGIYAKNLQALQHAPALRRFLLPLESLICASPLDTLAALPPPFDCLRLELEHGRVRPAEPAPDSPVKQFSEELDALAQCDGGNLVSRPKPMAVIGERETSQAPTPGATFGRAYLVPGLCDAKRTRGSSPTSCRS
jgi:hypothetical protein